MATTVTLSSAATIEEPNDPAPMAPANGYRVLVVTPRKMVGEPSTGREKLLRGLLDCGADTGAIETVTIPDIFAGRHSTRKLAAALINLVWDFTHGRPGSLQSVLFRGPSGQAALTEAIQRFKPDILYFDSIRLAHLAPRGSERPCVIVDLDDLLSRRIQCYGRAGVKQGVGELGQRIPGFIVKLLENPQVSKLYFALEKAITRRTELWATREADALILTSPAEARALARYARRYAKVAPLLLTHPMAVRLKPPIGRSQLRRITFVGTARLPQNQDGIAWCRKAAAESDSLQVGVYGSGKHPTAPGEPRFIGFIDDLTHVYAADAAPTCMTRVRGGVKTKILEAWSYGAPIVVTPQGLEGIDIKGYPLVAAWDASAKDVRDLLTPEAMEKAVSLGRAYLDAVYAADSIGARWLEVFNRAQMNYQRRFPVT